MRNVCGTSWRARAARWAIAVPLAGLSAGPAAAADTGVPPVATILERINQAYADVFEVPRRATIVAETVVRREGQPDLVVHSRSVALQHRRNVRFETPPGATTVRRGGLFDSDAPGNAGGALIWVHDGQVMKSRYLPPAVAGRPARAQEFQVDHGEMPEAFGPRFTDPMAAPELAWEFMNAEWTAQAAYFNGEPAIRLRSKQAITLSHESAMEVVFWVDAESYLVHRMESAIHKRATAETPAAQVYGRMDMAYELDIEIDPAAFELDLGAESADITATSVDWVAEKLRARDRAGASTGASTGADGTATAGGASSTDAKDQPH